MRPGDEDAAGGDPGREGHEHDGEGRGDRHEGAGAPLDDHIINMAETPPDQQRPMPWRIVAVVVALLLGGVVGYALGNSRHGTENAASGRSQTAASPAPQVKPFPRVSFTGRQCSVQTGHRLQLGTEITNDTDQVVMLQRIDIGVPLHLLRILSKQFGTCGAVGGNTGPQPLAPGNSTWMTADFEVATSCPVPEPVIFVAEFEGGSSVMGGFPDLQGVPYSGCPSPR
jgi:hypothetical protein